MKRVIGRALLLALAASSPAWGQFELYLVNGAIEQPVVQTYNLGDVEPGSSLSVPFRITNISADAATLNLLTVNGTGFSLAGATAAIPASLASQQSIDFTVVFQSNGTGIYSAALESMGISVTLTAIVPVELTCQLISGTGVQLCAAAPLSFGSVPLGTAATLQIALVNQTGVPLPAPSAQVTGAGFSLSGPSPGVALVQPTAGVTFNIQFSPTADGAAAGMLTIGNNSYPLTGMGVEPPFPQPLISVTLPQPGSAEQGAVAVNLSAASPTSGTGTVTLTFAPAASLSNAPADPGIAFISGGQSATFSVSSGATQGYFGAAITLPFQTGTTAGTLTITAQLGATSVQQSITILPAVVGVTTAQAVRSAGTVEIDLTGFDNTRTAGALSFTFYDAGGNSIAPPIQTDGTATFAGYFQNSAGGTFELKAIFPVLGNTSQITAFQAAVTNSAGTTTTAHTSF
jgi:Abnormal spindle-like microcephaly-assoc'd, ASPM-SPD-2-Hydin